MDDYFCPLCNADLRGDPIPQEYIDKGYYGKSRWYSRMIGVEIRGVYDGVLYYACPDCGGAWQRWTASDMRRRAQPYIDQHNAKAGQ